MMSDDIFNEDQLPQSDNKEEEPLQIEGNLVDQAVSEYAKEIAENQKVLTKFYLTWRKIIAFGALILFCLFIIAEFVFDFILLWHIDSFEKIQNSSVVSKLLLTNAIAIASLASIIIALFVRFPDISSKIMIAIHNKNSKDK